MNYSQLRAFHAVAEHGSFTRAAAALRLTQPTLSGQVKALQLRYGVGLFERFGQGVRLTEIGHALHEVTRRLFAMEAEAEQLLVTARGLNAGRLRLAADAPANIIPVLVAFNRRYPKIQLAVTIGNSAQVMSELMERRCDVAVLPDVRRDPRFVVIPVRRDRLVLLVGADHPWRRRRSVRIRGLDGSRLVLREAGSRTRSVFEAAMDETGTRPGEIVEISTREGVTEAVAAGLGVGVVFKGEFRADKRIRTIELHGAPVSSAEYVVCLATRAEQPVVKAFLDLVPAMGADLGAGAPAAARGKLEDKAAARTV